MNSDRTHSTLARYSLLIAGAMTLLLASPGFAQEQEQSPNKVISGSVRKGPITKNLSAPEQDRVTAMKDRAAATDSDAPAVRNGEQAVIERSFNNDARLSRASQIKAGTSLDDSQEDAGTPSPARQENITEVPEGTAVIMKDGEVIARSTYEKDPTATADARPRARKRQEPLPANVNDESARTSDRKQAGGDHEIGDRRSIYKLLEGTPVVNTRGQEIGHVEDVAVIDDSGETGLIVATSGNTGNAKILAPVQELVITRNNVLWNTPSNKIELQQSKRYNSDNYSYIANGQSRR